MKWMTAIAAMGTNRVIGDGERIPWHLPEDLRWFKEKTMDGAMLMGRKTFDAIGGALPGRETFVVSRGADIPKVHMVRDLENFDPAISERPFYVCGGGEIYRQTMHRCSDVLITLVNLAPSGKTLMPVFENDFRLIATLRETPEFSILHYRAASLILCE